MMTGAQAVAVACAALSAAECSKDAMVLGGHQRYDHLCMHREVGYTGPERRTSERRTGERRVGERRRFAPGAGWDRRVNPDRRRGERRRRSS